MNHKQNIFPSKSTKVIGEGENTQEGIILWSLPEREEDLTPKKINKRLENRQLTKEVAEAWSKQLHGSKGKPALIWGESKKT